MEDLEYKSAVKRVLHDACDFTPEQTGDVAGQVISLHGVTPDAVIAMWKQLATDDRRLLVDTVNMLLHVDLATAEATRAPAA